ncbi:hypothetical protein EIP86_001947 [Pleurotus ostreatoroseus]|nr:hypothetical protein EIP86_001947 [Pleurotus ostreatoroseus]
MIHEHLTNTANANTIRQSIQRHIKKHTGLQRIRSTMPSKSSFANQATSKWAGTNTYLIGQRNPYILVDTGEGLPEYIPFLEDALSQAKNENEFRLKEAEISDIILTHRHLDHVGGLPSVLECLRKRWTVQHGTSYTFTSPRIHKYPLVHPDSEKVFHSLCPGDFESTETGDIVHALHEGQKFPISIGDGADAGDMYLEIMHVPGHTPDSICLYMPADKVLYTGDTILGHGSTVFEDLYTYMESLGKMLRFCVGPDGTDSPRYTQLYPGHGPVVPHTHVEMYQSHRNEREKQILDVLAKKPPDGESHWTTLQIVKDIYKGYPDSLHDAAAHSANQHLKKLEVEGRVNPVGGRGHHLAWHYSG